MNADPPLGTRTAVRADGPSRARSVSAPSRPQTISAVLILVAAFALRCAANAWLTVPTPKLANDDLWYHATATSLAAGHGYVHYLTHLPTASWPPGYPAILAVVYRLFGADPSRAFFLNALAGTLACWLVGRLARQVSTPRVALAAMALVALMPSQILFASLAMSETVFTAILLALVIGAIALVRRTRQTSYPPVMVGWLAWGAGVGLASLVRAEAVVLVLPPLAVLALSRVPARRLAPALALAALGVLVAELPWLVRNAHVFGRVVPVSSSFGRTLLIGHNPEAAGDMNVWSPDPAADARDVAIGGPAAELAVDDRRRAAAIAFIKEHPGSEITLVAQRFYRMWRGDRVWSEWFTPGEPSRPGAATIELLGKISNLYYWLLLALAAPTFAGWLRERDPARRLLPLVAIVWTAFFVLVLYGSQRFHFPLMPLACIFAAHTAFGRSPQREA